MSYNSYFTTQWNRAEKEAYKAGIRKGEKNMTTTQEERLITAIDRLTVEVQRATKKRAEHGANYGAAPVHNPTVHSPDANQQGGKGEAPDEAPKVKGLGRIEASDVVKGLVKEIQKILGTKEDGILSYADMRRLVTLGAAQSIDQ